MFHTIAIHDVVPAHREEFLAFMRRVEEAAAGLPGLVEFSSYADAVSGRLVGLARWESREDFEAGLPTIMSLSSERRPEWTAGEDQLLLLAPA